MSVSQTMKSPMSDVLISKYFNGRPNIQQMSQISTMSSLNQVFRGYDHAVIFVAVNGPADGHWQFIYKSSDELHFFDSYGMSPTQLIQDLQSSPTGTFGQNTNLDTLIMNSQYANKCYKNDVKYQSDGEPQTCGRYVSLCFLLMVIYKQKNVVFDGSVYFKIMQHLKTIFKNSSYDNIVSQMIDQVDLTSI
jgi:hypothetical protein